jgi:exosome complex component CSL4
LTQKQKIVLPGEFITVEEEFEAGRNAYEDKDGKVFSAKIGVTEFDEKNRNVSVKEAKRKCIPIDFGTIVIGRVILVKDSVVIISIGEAEKNGEKRIPVHSNAQLLVSNVSRDYVKSLRNEFRIGDIVKAKVVKVTKHSIDLTTSFPEFGVIKAFCTKCRNALQLFGRQLKCTKCGAVEKRKISTEYLLK